MAEGTTTWKFPGTFWVANMMELFERAAYYGCFIFLTVYLTQRVHFTDIETGWITGAFSFLLYFMPTPGGSGIAEILAQALMSPFMPSRLLVAYTAVWRFFLTYLTVVAGGAVLFRWKASRAREPIGSSVTSL